MLDALDAHGIETRCDVSAFIIPYDRADSYASPAGPLSTNGRSSKLMRDGAFRRAPEWTAEYGQRPAGGSRGGRSRTSRCDGGRSSRFTMRSALARAPCYHRSSGCVQSPCACPSTLCGRSSCQPRAMTGPWKTGCTTNSSTSQERSLTIWNDGFPVSARVPLPWSGGARVIRRAAARLRYAPVSAARSHRLQISGGSSSG